MEMDGTAAASCASSGAESGCCKLKVPGEKYAEEKSRRIRVVGEGVDHHYTYEHS